MFEAILFPTAAALYAWAIVGEYVQKTLKPWSVRMFFVALSIDATATVLVCIIRPGVSLLPSSSHAWWGYAALLIMAVHAFWALQSLRRGGNYLWWFHRCSPFAGMVWSYAFWSGIPS